MTLFVVRRQQKPGKPSADNGYFHIDRMYYTLDSRVRGMTIKDILRIIAVYGSGFLAGAAVVGDAVSGRRRGVAVDQDIIWGIREIREIGGYGRKRGLRLVGWGYLFSKAVGMAAATWIVYVLGTIRVMPFSVVSIGVAITAVFLLGLWGNKGDPTSPRLRGASKGDKGDRGNWGE